MKAQEPQTSHDPDALLTYRQVAALAGVSERTIWTAAASGEIPPIRIGRCVRFRRSAVHEWLRELEEAGR